MAITLKDSTSLSSAYLAESYPGGKRFPVRTYDDCWGQLWLFGCEHGVTHVIRTRTFEQAWEIAIDESPTISDELSDIAEAYGYYGPDCLNDAGESWHDAVRGAKNCENFPELIEGYEYQSNMSGTGIVDVGHYAWLREAEAADFQNDNRLRVVITAD